MKVLCIDDKEIDVKGIKLFCLSKDWGFEWKSFNDDYYKAIMEEDPDIVVLDWFEGPDGDKDYGEKIFNSIWENGYRPIVIFSGQADRIILDQPKQESNILRLIKKGNDDDITEYLEKYEKYFEMLSNFRKNIGKVIINSVNVIEPLKQIQEEFLSEEVFHYILAKRMVNAFDIEKADIELPEWGMYIYPPVSNVLKTGDIIKLVESDTDKRDDVEKEGYKIIISQACDLAHGKIEDALCLNCKTIKEGIMVDIKCEVSRSIKQVANASGEVKKEIKSQILKSKLKEAMNSGVYHRWGVLPELKDVCPDMSVDFKSGEYINIENIACDKLQLKEGQKYYRVASLDSQYVSQLVWGYMQNACRPGATDRTVNEWVEKFF